MSSDSRDRHDHSERNFMVAVVFLAGFFVLGMWLPQWLHERELLSRIQAAQKRLGFDEAGAVALVDLAREVNQLRDMVSQSDRYVPASSELGPLLQKLSPQKAAGLKQPEIVTRQVVAGSDYSVIPISVQFEGQFQDTFEYLKSVESMHRLVQVNRVSLTAEPQKRDTPLRVELDLSTFYAPTQGGKP